MTFIEQSVPAKGLATHSGVLTCTSEGKHRKGFRLLHFKQEKEETKHDNTKCICSLSCCKTERLCPKTVYQVYVVELKKKVFTEHAKFRAANPQFNGVLECLYVGMTSKTPKERFEQHKTGYVNKKGHKLSASLVYKYGSYLRPSLYHHINQKPMTRDEALAAEEQLALELRRKGYAVWFN